MPMSGIGLRTLAAVVAEAVIEFNIVPRENAIGCEEEL